MSRYAVFLLLAFVLLAGCFEGGGTCPEEEGSVLCGLCSEKNQCHYCDTGQTCVGDVCGDYQCVSPRVETPLFQLVGGRLVPTGTTPATGWVGDSTYSVWLVITLENGTDATEGYTYSVEGELPPGLTLTPDGHLTGMPTTVGDYTFSICATDAAGGKTCREVPMHVGMPTPYPTYIPSASPTPTPSATPTAGPVGIFDGSWEGTVTLMMYGPEGSFPAGCSMQNKYTFNIWHISGESQFSGNAEATMVGGNCGWMTPSSLFGQTSAAPITNVKVNGQTGTFSTGQTDYTITVSGNTATIWIETCQSPDPRCTCDSPDPRCPAEEIDPGVFTPVHESTDNWWEGEGFVYRNYNATNP